MTNNPTRHCSDPNPFSAEHTQNVLTDGGFITETLGTQPNCNLEPHSVSKDITHVAFIPEEFDTDEVDGHPEEDEWSRKKLYLLQSAEHEELNDMKKFFGNKYLPLLKVENDVLTDSAYLTRYIRQAIIEVGMQYPALVTERARAIRDRTTADDEWGGFVTEIQTYLKETMLYWNHQLQSECWDLRQEKTEKRVFEQAIIEVGMEHPDEVVEQTKRIADRIND